MSDIETSTISEEGFTSTSQDGDLALTLDAPGEDRPDPSSALGADDAPCSPPA